jgi:hypothetical protein
VVEPASDPPRADQSPGTEDDQSPDERPLTAEPWSTAVDEPEPEFGTVAAVP